MTYKVPAHLRGEIDLKALRADLERLERVEIDGLMNLCYGDGYYAKSIVEKYGRSIIELKGMLGQEDRQMKIFPS